MSVNIELQVKKQDDFLERTTLYAYKLIAREVGNGLDYNKMPKTIIVNILDFELLRTKNYITKTVTAVEEDRCYEIIENPKWYFIELSKFRKTNPNLDDKLTQWLLFIDDFNNEGLKMAESKNQTLKQA